MDTNFYYEALNDPNGVAIAVVARFRDKISLAERKTDLQPGCNVNEKDQFWMNLGDYTSTITKNEILLLGLGLNGNVDKIRDDACRHVDL